MLELTVTVKRNNKEITLTADQLRKLINALDNILEESRKERLRRRQQLTRSYRE
jgi:hypothetical protein